MPFKIIVSKTALMTKTGLTDIRIISILCDLCLGTPCSVEIFYDRKWYDCVYELLKGRNKGGHKIQ